MRLSRLTDDQIKNQNPANFLEFSVQKSPNTGQKVYCVELEQQFPIKSDAIIAMEEAGHPPFIQRTLNKAIEEGGLAGGFHWELVEE